MIVFLLQLSLWAVLCDEPCIPGVKMLLSRGDNGGCTYEGSSASVKVILHSDVATMAVLKWCDAYSKCALIALESLYSSLNDPLETRQGHSSKKPMSEFMPHLLLYSFSTPATQSLMEYVPKLLRQCATPHPAFDLKRESRTKHEYLCYGRKLVSQTQEFIETCRSPP